MRATRFLHSATIIGAIALIPRVVSPQLAGSVVFTPFAGAYVPANDVAKVIAPSSALAAAARQKSASAFGGNLSYWLNERVAVEGGAHLCEERHQMVGDDR